jgi:hypothetical protein
MEGPEFEVSELDELERIVGDATAKPKRLAFSLLERITNNFSSDYQIGLGGFSVVYKVRKVLFFLHTRVHGYTLLILIKQYASC